MSLYLGSEIFDVHLQPTVGDHNHLFVRQGAGLQGQDLFRTKLTFRPHSTDTLTHRKMTLSMADRGNKAQKVKVLAAVGKDPESMKQEMVRREEERLRASARRESKQRREREREVRRPLGPGFLEDASDDDDPDAHSLSALKKSFKPGGRAFDRLRSGELSDEDGSAASEDWEAEKSSRLEKAKRVLDSDDDEDAVVASTSETKKKKRVIESDEDDEVGKEDDD